MKTTLAFAEPASADAPVRVALVGAGVTGRMIAAHLLSPVPGIRLVAIANRTVEKAIAAFAQPGVRVAQSPEELDHLIARHRPAVVDDALIACAAHHVDVIVEVTGTIEFGAQVALAAFRHRKSVVLVNAELDATLGPILKVYADRAGVIVTNTDGDEPGVAMTLLRYLRSIGLRPIAAGNLKGLIDHYRTPETQKEFARQHRQNPVSVTSFADGTKLALETTILANATGFRVGRRGMFGHACPHVNDLAALLPLAPMLEHGLVDYALGAAPHTGAFVLAYEDSPRKRQDLAYFKMGAGPVYTFYTPYHLPHLQVAASIQAADRGEATIAPLGGPVCEVAAVSKRNLRAGERLDGIGGFMTYGVIENAAPFAKEDLLPIGVAAGCVLRHNVPKDQPLTYADVILPSGRLCDRLRREQAEFFHPVPALPAHAKTHSSATPFENILHSKSVRP